MAHQQQPGDEHLSRGMTGGADHRNPHRADAASAEAAGEGHQRRGQGAPGQGEEKAGREQVAEQQRAQTDAGQSHAPGAGAAVKKQGGEGQDIGEAEAKPGGGSGQQGFEGVNRHRQGGEQGQKDPAAGGGEKERING